MPLPLFALGLLAAGTGIAKGVYDETVEERRKREALQALMGPAEILADPVGAGQRHLAQSGNPFGLSGRGQEHLASDPRAIDQQQRQARTQAVRAMAELEGPKAALEMAQNMAPRRPDDKYMEVDGRLVHIPGVGGNPRVVIDAKPEKPPSTQLSNLIDIRDRLPEGHPNRALYDAAIAKETERAGGAEETWSNPVAEIGPDGKPIQVRYGSKGGRQPVSGATPARQGNAFDRQDYWRGQFKPYLDSAQNAIGQSRKVTSSLALETGVGDIAAINALQKQIDEGAVVRDQDVALIQSAQSLIGRFIGADGAIKKGTVLTPKLRNQIKQASDTLTSAIQDGAKSRIEPYIETLKTEGVDFENIVPVALRGAYGWGKKPQSAPTNKPIEELDDAELLRLLTKAQ